MPHLAVEYTENLKRELDLPRLLKELHCSLSDCQGLDINRVKSRLIQHPEVLGGPNASPIKMVHVTLSVLSGREVEVRKGYGRALNDTLHRVLPAAMHSLVSLTVEIREMDRDCYQKN